MGLIKSSAKSQKPSGERRKKERDFNTLTQQLHDEDPIKRRWAARDLLEYREQAIDALCKRLEKEKDQSVQDVILNVLLEINREPIAEKLLPFLSSEDAALRNRVIEVLQKMPYQMEKHIEKLLDHPDPDVRIFTINILSSLKHKHVPKWILDVALRDEHVNVVSTALDALSELVVTYDMRDNLLKIKDKFKDEPYINFVIDSILEGIE